MAQRATSPGYSLLELLVVLGIMGLIAAVAVPIVTTSVDRMTLATDARAVATQLRAWRDDAMDQQKEVVVTPDVGALRAEGGDAAILSSGTSVEIVEAKAFLISPDGTARGSLRLSRSGASVHVRMSPVTGRIWIEPDP
jgi:prepilin-type N-terminal cleavage/methylation domain-containing protein